MLNPLVMAIPTLLSAPFSHGVAAGDVTDDAAVLWTRADAPGEVRVEVALDEAFQDVVFERLLTASVENGLTVKIDANGLSAGTHHLYRFIDADGVTGDIGRFRTAPRADEPAAFRFVFTGDSNYANAPFSLLNSAAEERADFFIWFGDTTYADIPAGVAPRAVTLDQYRAHYRQDRTDENLRRLLAATPVWVGWDDHEVLGDYAGAVPATFGSVARLDAAYHAFFESMPIRPAVEPDAPFRTYRRFRYGALAEFFLLDVRQYRERDASADCGDNPNPFALLLARRFADAECIARLSAPRTMLGADQLAWLKVGLLESDARFKFVVVGLPMSFIGLRPYDRWDGYDAERRELMEFVDAAGIEGVWLLATDAHSNAFNPDATSYFRRSRPAYRLGGGVRMPEIIAGPIAAVTLRQSATEFAGGLVPDGPATDLALELAFANLVDELRALNDFAYFEGDRYGYAVIDVDPVDGVNVSFRTLTPQASASGEHVRAETRFTTSGAGASLPCAAPIAFALAGGGLCVARTTRRSRR